MNIYSFTDYRKYLQSRKDRGFIAQLAKLANCQPVYISRVLRGAAHLSHEQARSIQPLLDLNDEGLEYFLLLIDFDRAGTESLRNFYRKKIDQIRVEERDKQKKISEAKSLGPEQQSIYYSSAHYALVHACVSVPKLQTLNALEEHLRLPRSRLIEVLTFLSSVGIISEHNGKYEIGTRRLHLGRNEGLIRQHHTNFRIEAIRSLDEGRGAQEENSLHYSALVGISEEDALKLREHWIRALEEFNKTVAPSKEETVRAIVIDFFSPLKV